MTNIEVNGKVYKVKLALSTEEKEQGLQGVESLPEDEGMLFIYEEPSEANFWMDQTLIPLDIIFIDEYGEVISVVEGKPNDKTNLTEQNVSFVLELNAGSGVTTGDEVDLSELDEEDTESPEEDATESPEEESAEKVASKMQVLSANGESQMELEGGERIFSRIHTRKLISLSKKASKSKKDADYKKLGKKVFEYIDKQDTQKQEYVST